ncbi:MAG: fasciclin domain-containing protein [Phototrophicaceae bacterium]
MIGALLLAACGGESATNTPEPTNTPQPTETPEPTEQPTEEPAAVEEEEVEEASPEAQEATEEEEEPGTIVDTAADAGDFSTLLAAVEAAGLVDELNAEGPLTVFAPTDEAFASALVLLGLTAEELLADTETLTNILLYHVVDGEFAAEDVMELDGESVPTLLEDAEIAVSIDEDDNVLLNEMAMVVLPNVAASNGIIHVIDAVLLPPTAEEELVEEEATEEAAAEEEAAEEEAAEEEVVDEEAAEEVAEEQAAAAEAAEEEAAEEEAAEEEAAEEEAAEEEVAEEEAAEEPGTVVEVAMANEDFETLVAAVVAAELAETLSGEGPFTVFAPTDDAFAAALEALDLSAEELLADTETLTNILLYHVVEGEVLADDVAELDGESVPTLLEGAEIVIGVEDGIVTLNETVNVIAADVMASNGVIHVINGVLLPPAAEVEAAEEEAAEEEAAEEEAAEEEAAEEEVAEEEAEMDAAAPLISRVCLVTDQGGIDDGNFNQLASEGMFEAGSDFGLETTVIESAGTSDFAPNIQTCIETGHDVVITVGFLLTDATLEAAETNPDVYFIGVDQFFEDGPENLVGNQFREDQAGFLVGVMAARMTESNVIAGVYGIDVPAVVKFRHGFEQGARYINPDIVTLGEYGESFIDSAGGANTAEQFMGEGADVIFGAGGATGTGGIQYAAAQDVWVIGVDQDEYFTNFGGGESPGAEYLMTSALKSVDVGVYDMLAALVGEPGYEWIGGGVYTLEAANNGIGVAPSHDADVPQEVINEVMEIFEMLKLGELDTGVDGLTGEIVEFIGTPAEETEE